MDRPRQSQEEPGIAAAREQFLPLSRAAIVLGVDRRRVRDAIARGDLPSFSDPLNRRHILVSVEDLDRLRRPRPRTQETSAVTIA